MVVQAFGYSADITDMLTRGGTEWGQYIPVGDQANTTSQFNTRASDGTGSMDRSTTAFNQTRVVPVDKKYVKFNFQIHHPWLANV